MRGSQEDAVALLEKEFSWRALGYWRGGTTTTGRREGASERRTPILQKPALQVLVEHEKSMQEQFKEFVNGCEGGRRSEQSSHAAN
jgi:hypothetical protein